MNLLRAPQALEKLLRQPWRQGFFGMDDNRRHADFPSNSLRIEGQRIGTRLDSERIHVIWDGAPLGAVVSECLFKRHGDVAALARNSRYGLGNTFVSPSLFGTPSPLDGSFKPFTHPRARLLQRRVNTGNAGKGRDGRITGNGPGHISSARAYSHGKTAQPSCPSI